MPSKSRIIERTVRFVRCQRYVPRGSAAALLLALLLLTVQHHLPTAAAAQHSNTTGRLGRQLLTRYLTNAELAAWTLEFATRCSRLAKRYSIGVSREGRRLWALELSSSPGAVEAKPAFRYVANMHGDETSGRALLPALAEWLCDSYGSNANVTRLLDGAHLHMLPTMNPDGYARSSRYNAADADLNRGAQMAHTAGTLLHCMEHAACALRRVIHILHSHHLITHSFRRTPCAPPPLCLLTG